MHKEVTARQTMFRSALRFCGKPEFVLPPGAQELVATLRDIDRSIENLGRDQVTGSGKSSASVANRMEIGRVLRNALRQITNVAHRLDPVQFPGIAEHFQMPVSKGYPALLNSARSFIAKLAPVPVRDLFASRLGHEFLDQLPTLVSDFEAVTTEKNTGRAERIASTAGLLLAARRGLAIVRELDPVMVVLLQNQPEQLVAWKSLSRVIRSSRSAQPASSTESSSAEPAPGVEVSAPAEINATAEDLFRTPPAIAAAPERDTNSLVTLMRFRIQFHSEPEPTLPETAAAVGNSCKLASRSKNWSTQRNLPS